MAPAAVNAGAFHLAGRSRRPTPNVPGSAGTRSPGCALLQTIGVAVATLLKALFLGASGGKLAAAMARGNKLKATFGDGAVASLVTDKAFTHAWRVSGKTPGGVAREINGWARNEQAATQASAIYARRQQQRQRWRDVRTEVVRAERV